MTSPTQEWTTNQTSGPLSTSPPFSTTPTILACLSATQAPPFVLMSNNYYKRQWTSPRRLKNIVSARLPGRTFDTVPLH